MNPVSRPPDVRLLAPTAEERRTGGAEEPLSDARADLDGNGQWPRRQRWLVLAAQIAAVDLTLIILNTIHVYLPADAGHYLADADAIFGHGVRESRHLPVFPILIGAIHLVVGDVTAALLAMVVVVACLLVGFHAFVRGRLGSPLAEAVGALFFILSPVIAEGIGWYGASMLLGLALSLIAMRLVDDALTSPTAAKAAAAGFVCGLVGLTHPLPFLLLAQVTALVSAIVLTRAVLSRRREGRWAWDWLRRRLFALGGIAGLAAAMTLPFVDFYTELRSPLTVAFDPLRLGPLGSWAFRGDSVLWVGLLLLAGFVLLGSARRLHGEQGLRMGLWALAIAAVPLATVVLTAGNPAYTYRYAYALPLTLGCTAAIVVDLVTRGPIATRLVANKAVPVVLAVVLSLCLIRVGQSYAHRLDVALKYYNPLTSQELKAVRWLSDRRGTVAVSAKGGDQVAGTLYAWTIEGMARMRAIGTDEAFVALLDRAHQDSLDVERLLSGAVGVENGRLRLSASGGELTPIEIGGMVDGDWFPLATISVGPLPATPPQAGPVEARSDGPSAIVVDHHGLAVAGSLAPSGQSDLALKITRSQGSEPVAVAVDPPRFATSALLRAEGRRSSIELAIRGRPVRIEVSATGGAARVDNDARSGAARLHLDGADATDLGLDVRVTGLDNSTKSPFSFHDTELLQRHGVRYVFTWRQTALAPVLADRSCFVPAMENAEVVIFKVQETCWRRPAVPLEGR